MEDDSISRQSIVAPSPKAGIAVILLIIGLTASVVFLGYAVLSRPVQQPRDVIIARVAAAAEALRVGDIQQLVDSLPPDLVKRWGAPGSLKA